MSLEKEDFERITKIFAEAMQPPPPVLAKDDRGKMVDWLFKGFVGLLVWIGSGMNDNLEIVMADVNQIKTERLYDDRDMANVQAVLQEPRFTREDDALVLTAKLTPIITQMNRNTSILDVRTSVIDANSENIVKLQYAEKANTKAIAEILNILQNKNK